MSYIVDMLLSINLRAKETLVFHLVSSKFIFFALSRKVKLLQKILPFRKEYKFIVSPKIVRN